MSNGEIIEQGTHENLIAAGGKYSELWSKQVSSPTISKPTSKRSTLPELTIDVVQIFVRTTEDMSDDEDMAAPNKSTHDQAECLKAQEDDDDDDDDDNDDDESSSPSSTSKKNDDTKQSTQLKTPSGHRKEV